jgi:hypothetical protein
MRRMIISAPDHARQPLRAGDAPAAKYGTESIERE